MSQIKVDGARVHYAHKKGGERAVVFLHGGFGSSSELWSGAMAALPEGWSGYAPDNFLRSDPPPDGYSVSAFCRRTAGFIRALGLPRAVLVGHSMGGVVSQLVAIRHPELVAGLALVCTGPSMTNHELGRRLLAKLQRDGASEPSMREISSAWFRDPQALPFFEAYVQRATTAPLGAMVSVQQSLIEADLRPELGGIQAPTLVVYAAHDTGRTMEHARMLLDGIAGSQLATMPDSGHSPMVETPERFNSALHAFLAALPEPAAA